MNTRKYSDIQEKQVARALGGRKNANSGATAFVKGDVQLKDFLVECKTVMQKKSSISIKQDWLDKLKREAFSMNKPYSMLAFNFEPNGKNYYVMDENLVCYLLELLNKEELNGN